MGDETPAATPIEQLSLADIAGLIGGNTELIDFHKARIAELQNEVTRRLGESAQRAYEQAGKESGALSLELQDGLTAKMSIDKKIAWDSAKLMAIAQTMPWDRVEALFKIVFSVPENTYKGVAAADPELQKKLDDARTTTLSPVKITLERSA